MDRASAHAVSWQLLCPQPVALYSTIGKPAAVCWGRISVHRLICASVLQAWMHWLHTKEAKVADRAPAGNGSMPGPRAAPHAAAPSLCRPHTHRPSTTYRSQLRSAAQALLLPVRHLLSALRSQEE